MGSDQILFAFAAPMTAPVRSFPPIVDHRATRLILGSMPGVASLTANQYYAHSQNAFWRIMGEAVGIPREATYVERTERLQAAGIALWDVLQLCERPGSLDSAIRRDSEVVNDFNDFFARYTHITRVFFNGAAAEAAFRRHCPALLGNSRLAFHRLPSTSPAHAALRFEQKSALWCNALG